MDDSNQLYVEIQSLEQPDLHRLGEAVGLWVGREGLKHQEQEILRIPIGVTVVSGVAYNPLSGRGVAFGVYQDSGGYTTRLYYWTPETRMAH